MLKCRRKRLNCIETVRISKLICWPVGTTANKLISKIIKCLVLAPAVNFLQVIKLGKIIRVGIFNKVNEASTFPSHALAM